MFQKGEDPKEHVSQYALYEIQQQIENMFFKVERIK
jgi:hypothetical protein